MNESHPALLAARASWSAVQQGDKDAWLGLMAEDICIEDPIGVAPTNPTGDGVRGKAAVSEFWDKTIGPNQISIETHESRTAGMESAHVLTLTVRFDNGAASRVHGIFTYTLDDEEKLTNLRGYWDMQDMAFDQPSE